MAKLITTPNLPNLDDLYEVLLQLHDGKTADESAALDAKMILLMANHIGDMDVLREIIQAATLDQK